MESVDVIIGTYGDQETWSLIAQQAVISAQFQTVPAHKISHTHSDTLQNARNMGAYQSDADWLIFLDADDELDPRYIEEMLKGRGHIRQPSTLGVVDGVEDDYPVLIPPGPSFMVKNHLVIGSMVRRELFEAVGGFRDLPVLEDWDLWIRCQLAGGTVGRCPDAIYRVHVRSGSRNQNSELHGQVYSQIQNEYQTAWYSKGFK